jgi:3-hydroxyacyl-CoA dehydrogenase
MFSPVPVLHKVAIQFWQRVNYLNTLFGKCSLVVFLLYSRRAGGKVCVGAGIWLKLVDEASEDVPEPVPKKVTALFPTTEPQASQLATPGQRNTAALVAWNRQRADARYAAAGARPIRSVGIAGAGSMGASIAAAVLKSKLPVVITDARPQALDDLPARIAAELAEEDEPGGTPAPQPPPTDKLLRRTAELAEVAGCDVVLESVVEHLFVKEKVLGELEAKLAPGAVLGSNTSTISIGRLAQRLADPSRFCGMHFFLPVPRRPLVEVVRGPQSSVPTLAAAVAFARALGKSPLVVDDGPGFLVNRLMMLYLSEGLQLVAEGAPIEQVEQVADDFGMAAGPMTLIDQIGLDVVLDCGWVLAGALGGSMVSSPLLVAMVKAGRLGRKSGAGFFSYRAGCKTGDGRPDPAVAPLLARCAAPPQEHAAETITARLFLPMLLEATRVLAEGRVEDPRDVDLGVIFGFGFPAARGGLLHWADTLGANRIVEMLRPLAPLGARARPTPLLLEMAAAGRRFYGSEEGQSRGEGESEEQA